MQIDLYCGNRSNPIKMIFYKNLIKANNEIIYRSVDRFAISRSTVSSRSSKSPMYRNRIYAVPLGGGTTHRIPDVIPTITLSLAANLPFFALSTRLLAREIARIASRQYLNSRREKERMDPPPPRLFRRHPSPSLSLSSRKRYFYHYVYSLLHSFSLLVASSPTISRFLARLHCKEGVTSSPVFSNARATKKPCSSRSRRGLSRTVSRFSAIPQEAPLL